MNPQHTARKIIERAGKLLDATERVFLRMVAAGLASASGEMWDDINRTFAHCLK